MNETRVVHVESEADVQRKFQGGPAIFLSASVPYRRNHPPHIADAERERIVALNQRYLDSAKPARIRSAVVAMTRTLLMKGMRLVFGAHPAISPMVLSTARDVQAKQGSILIFQSAYFEHQLPKSTLELAAWEAGVLVFTPLIGQSSDPTTASKQASLMRMRELMLAVPNLHASVFVGGMEGVSREAELFRERNPTARMYAVASTGSAALELWNGNASAYSGTLEVPAMLAEGPSYSVVATEILEDLRISGTSGALR